MTTSLHTPDAPPDPTPPSPRRRMRPVLRSRWFNYLVRFVPVLDMIEQSGIASGTILDVGSGSSGIAALLSGDWELTMLDYDFVDYGSASGPRHGLAKAVVGDVRAMPFGDRSFDIVVAMDLLEHIVPQDRATAIREICRVARHRALIACPAGPGAFEVDQRLAYWLRSRGHKAPGWLDEHLEYGMPDPEQMEAVAAEFGRVRVIGNESLAAHERLMRGELSAVHGTILRLGSGIVERLLVSRYAAPRRLARAILLRMRGGDSAPTYRTIVEVAIGDPFIADPERAGARDRAFPSQSV